MDIVERRNNDSEEGQETLVLERLTPYLLAGQTDRAKQYIQIGEK